MDTPNPLSNFGTHSCLPQADLSKDSTPLPVCFNNRLRTFPRELRGRDSTKSTTRGTLKPAKCRSQCVFSATSVIDALDLTTSAFTRSPIYEHGTPTTAASRMPGNPIIAASTSCGYTFAPPQ